MNMCLQSMVQTGKYYNPGEYEHEGPTDSGAKDENIIQQTHEPKH